MSTNMDLQNLYTQIVDGKRLTLEEALAIFHHPDLDTICDLANKLREHFCGNTFNLCSITNAKSGKCSEDCSYCAQSVHYETPAEEYPLLEAEEILKQAKANEKAGVDRYSLVTSGRGLAEKDFPKILELFRMLKENTKIGLCASLGILSVDHMRQLKDAGVEYYHHNIEAGPQFFDKVCTTHAYADRIQTVKNALEANLTVCSGGIIGLGEGIQDRLEMLIDIRELGVKSIPINILTPIEGTPLGEAQQLSPEEILRTYVTTRVLIPDAVIRYAGGRQNLGELETKGLQAGVNAALTGNYLTTTGSTIQNDLDMFDSEGFQK